MHQNLWCLTGDLRGICHMEIGFIGAGHLAGYLIEGLNRSKFRGDIIASAPDQGRVGRFGDRYGCRTTTDNQEVVDSAGIIVLCVRPEQSAPALHGLRFKPSHTLVSVVAGLGLDPLKEMVLPAKAVRMLPVSCAAVGKSPVLIFPEDKMVRHIFSCLGTIHVLPDESLFAPGTALVGAFYAWLFPFMGAMALWAEDQGVDPETARSLVIETVQGACAMAAHQKDVPFADIWATLATPGGISELGAGVLKDENSFSGWVKALDAVTQKMRNIE